MVYYGAMVHAQGLSTTTNPYRREAWLDYASTALHASLAWQMPLRLPKAPDGMDLVIEEWELR